MDNCKQCRFSKAIKDTDSDKVLECHRFPPQVQMYRDPSGAFQPTGFYPPTGALDVCGEFQPKLVVTLPGALS